MVFYEAINAFQPMVMPIDLCVTILLFTICWSFVLNVMLILCTETSVRSFKVRPAVTGAKPQPLQEIMQI